MSALIPTIRAIGAYAVYGESLIVNTSIGQIEMTREYMPFDIVGEWGLISAHWHFAIKAPLIDLSKDLPF